MKQLRDDQHARIEELNAVYSKHPMDKRAFLQMPVGTGKTFTALHFAIKRLSGSKIKSLIWVCHQTGLADQSAGDFRDDFKLFGGTLSDDLSEGKLKNISFRFMTWQGLRESINKKSASAYDMLIIDEAHYGSSNSAADKNGEHKSFKKILNSKLFDEMLFVSATPWDLNPEVFKDLLVKNDNGYSVKSDRIALLTLQDAKRLDLISDITFCVFHSADTIKLKSLNDEDQEIVTADDTKTLAEGILDFDVDFSHEETKAALRKSVTETTIEGFMRLESKTGKIPPTIVFCRGIDGDPRSINEAVKVIKKNAKKIFGVKFKTDSSFVSFCHSEMTGRTSTEVLSDFRAGKINILCVANMAQEGFNYPELEVGVDLAPSYSNPRRRMQRLGRLARKMKNKVARYYYSDTVTNYIMKDGIKNVMNQESKDKLMDVISKKCGSAQKLSYAETVSNSMMYMASINQHDSNAVDCEISAVYRGTDEVGDTLNCSLVGFVVTEASSEGKASTFRVASLFNVLEQKSNLIDWSTLSLNDLIAAAKLGNTVDVYAN